MWLHEGSPPSPYVWCQNLEMIELRFIQKTQRASLGNLRDAGHPPTGVDRSPRGLENAAMPNSSETLDAVLDVGSPQLGAFAESFADEDELHERLAVLFSKIENLSGVKVLQGTQEHGKDLIFYEDASLGDRRLIACVVKNTKISGSASSSSGSLTIMNQVRQAISNPYTGPSGELEFVSHVYVVSPYECSQAALNAIRGQLEGAKGQTTFFCGQTLFDLFSRYWPDYLFFETNLLSLYLTSVGRLDENAAFANLMTGNGLRIERITNLSDLYIRQEFVQIVPRFLISDNFPRWRNIDVALNRREIKAIRRQFDETKDFLSSAEIWSAVPAEQLEAARSNLDRAIQQLSANWEAFYEGFVASTSTEGSIPDGPNAVHFHATDSDIENLIGDITNIVESVLADFQRCSALVAQSAGSGTSERLVSESSTMLSRFKMASQAYPWILQPSGDSVTVALGANLLDAFDGMLLISGSAGFGKTSFCKMAAIRDAAAYARNSQLPLPIYFPLYKLNGLSVGARDNPSELFVESLELRRFLEEKQKRNEVVRLRVYLDGLDEVVEPERRAMALKLAKRLGDPRECQIVITSRDHVIERDLSHTPRVTLAAFSESQLRTLAQKWLPGEASDRFMVELRQSGELQHIVPVPLLANLTVALFRETNALPETVIRLYDMFVMLLCGGWDAAKGLSRTQSFGVITKRTVLTRLAWVAHSSNKRDFARSDFLYALRGSLNALESSVDELLAECLQDGILVRAGNRLLFAHLSFQEFLAAKHLSGPNENRSKQVVGNFLQGDTWWREVVRFYIAGAENPAEMADWIRKIAQHAVSRARAPIPEINARARDLVRDVEAFHKGYAASSSGLRGKNSANKN